MTPPLSCRHANHHRVPTNPRFANKSALFNQAYRVTPLTSPCPRMFQMSPMEQLRQLLEQPPEALAAATPSHGSVRGFSPSVASLR